MVMISINGNVLHISESGNMLEDTVNQDKMRLDISPVYNCKEFRAAALEASPEAPDQKQVSVDKVMAILEEMHTAAEQQ